MIGAARLLFMLQVALDIVQKPEQNTPHGKVREMTLAHGQQEKQDPALEHPQGDGHRKAISIVLTSKRKNRPHLFQAKNNRRVRS